VLDERHQRDVDEHAAVAALVDLELAQRLQERQRLDVADRAAHLGDDELDVLRIGDQLDAALDLIGDVRDDLNRVAQVVATALAADHRVVDRARGDVGAARGVDVGEALVVAQVQVGLGPVLGHEDLAVLERRHRARVDVDVRVELLERDLVTTGYEEPADRRGGDPLPERGDHPAGYEDEACWRTVIRHATSQANLAAGIRGSARSTRK
jgi:hypothetical protein